MSSKKYERNCPECNNIITYKFSSNFYTGRKKNTICKSCCQTGKRHKYYGKTFSFEHRKKLSESRMGNKNVNWGGISEKHRKNISKSLKNSEKIKLLANKKRGIPRSPEVKRKIRKSIIKDLQSKYGYQVYPNYNKQACKFFNEIERIFGWDGYHAEKRGEYYIKELGYWVDYYEPNLNIVIEYDEKKHNKTINKDLQRQKEIMNKLNCIFIRLKEEQENKLDFIRNIYEQEFINS